MAELGLQCRSRPYGGHGGTTQIVWPPATMPMRYSHEFSFPALKFGNLVGNQAPHTAVEPASGLIYYFTHHKDCREITVG